MIMRVRASMLACVIVATAACQPGPQQEQKPEKPDNSEPISIVRADADIDLVEPKPELKPLMVRVPFAGGGTELSEAALAELNQIMASAQLAAGGTITLAGHSDAGGTDAANIRASASRAGAVADWLISQGVAESRIQIIAFGEQNPVQPNALPDGTPNEPGRAANRRVEVLIALSKDNGQPSDQETATSLVEQVATNED